MAVGRLVVALLGGAALAAGCTTTRPPEVEYPGLVEEGTPREELCVLREGDHCFVGSVGERYIAQYGVNILSPGTYRQLLLPPGKHVLAVHYREQRNMETIVAGPRLVTIEARAGEAYELRSGVHGSDAWFADTLPAANWRPMVVTAGGGEVVGRAKVNQQ
jgi:hypothetical protein